MTIAKEVIAEFYQKRGEIEEQRRREVSTKDVEVVTIKGETIEESFEKYLVAVKKLQDEKLLVYAKFDNKTNEQILLVRKKVAPAAVSVIEDLPDLGEKSKPVSVASLKTRK